MTVVRPAREEDVDAAAEMLNQHSRRLYGADDLTPADLLMFWTSPDVELGQDVLLAESEAGRLGGYADLGVHGDAVWLDVRGTDPATLPALLEAIEERATTKEPDKKLWSYTSADDAPLNELLERRGYRRARHSFRMQVDLDEDLPKPEWPDDVSVRTMRDGEEHRVYEAQMASFADTWMFAPDPYDVWLHWMVEEPSFDRSLWFVAEQDGEPTGMVIARAPEHEPGVGWVRILGVLPEHRRRGIGQALLQHTFAEFARRGFAAVGLGVDAENPTGALRVYGRAGMHVERTHLVFEKLQG
jgi:ribosomal protein S18 acetylase RimI-like enzyme